MERPASVVKELVENALDAESTRVTIEVEKAGTRLIRVTDNGRGMSRNDLELAVQRHATSKLSSIDDLQRLNTLGFRGEALPSIAAVAELEIVTREPDAVRGHKLSAVPGSNPEIEPTGAAPGTTVTVRRLFATVPARRKHLSSPATEFNHISRVCYGLALGHPAVAFRLVHNESEVLQTPGADSVLTTVRALFGTAFARRLLQLAAAPESEKDSQCSGTHIRGFLGRPAQSRSSREHQYVFVNGRYLKSSLCRDAVENAYRGLLPLHRYPVFFLYLDIDGHLVDVNVHPTKRRARFSNAQELRQALAKRVRQTLHEAELIPSVSPRESSPGPEEDYHSSEQGNGSRSSRTSEPSYKGLKDIEVKRFLEDQEAYESYPGWPGFAKRVDETGSQPTLEELRALTQVSNSYIVAEGSRGLYIIDQHAAHERIVYEQLHRAVAADQPEQQFLAVPETLRLTPGENELLGEHAEKLRSWGFEWEPFSTSTIVLRAVPTLFRLQASAALFRELLDRLKELGTDEQGLLPEEHAKVVLGACKAAVKAHDQLDRTEQQALLEELAEAEAPYTCPHGRPTILELSFSELESYFKRT